MAKKKDVFVVSIFSTTRGNDNRMYERLSEKVFDNRADAERYGKKFVKPYNSKTGEYNNVFLFKNSKVEQI